MDRNEFTAYLGDFLDAYDNQSDKIFGNSLAFGAWYKHLLNNLSEEEIKPALQNALICFEFLPSPKQVVEAFKGTKEAIALEEFQDCLDASKNGNSENLLLSPQGEKALRSVGGLSRLAKEDTENLYRFVQKDFVRLWQVYERAIKSGTVSPPPLKLSPAPPDPPRLKEEFKPWDEATKDKWRKAMDIFKKRQQEMRGDE